LSYTLTVLDGERSIGGTKLLVAKKGSSILLDFGMNFAQRAHYYGDYSGPRSVKGVYDFLALGLLPPVPHWYRSDLFPPEFELPTAKTALDAPDVPAAVVLSHAHLDHAGYVSFLPARLPVYASLETALILKALQDTAATDIERDFAYLVPREAKDELLRARHYRTAAALGRDFRVFLPGNANRDTELRQKALEFWRQTPGSRELEAVDLTLLEGELTWSFSAGGFKGKAFAVDHSIPGACALALEIDCGWLVYTGDLRMHGRDGDLTRQFMDWLRRVDVAMLVTEGTNTDVQWPSSEGAVYENALQAVRWADGLAVADFGPRNVERLLIFLDIASETGRQLVLTSRDAYLLSALHGIVPECPDPFADTRLLVYGSALLNRRIWERLLLERLGGSVAAGGSVVTAADIAADPGAFILAFGQYDMGELLDINVRGGTYVYSSAEAHNEETLQDLQRLANWVEHFGLLAVGLPDTRRRSRHVRGEHTGALHVSGHMHGPGLIELMEAAAARQLVPVHTTDRVFFKRHAPKGTRVVYPKRGTPITIQ